MPEEKRKRRPGRPKGTRKVSEKDRCIGEGHSFPPDVHAWIKDNKDFVKTLARQTQLTDWLQSEGHETLLLRMLDQDPSVSIEDLWEAFL